MPKGERSTRSFEIGESETVEPGEFKHITLKITESSTGRPIDTPIFIANSEKPGPALFLVSGVHGNELNGVEIVREVMLKTEPSLLSGAVIMIPVTNVPGFLAGIRTLPNGEDLNRLFPGTKEGSPGERVADVIMSVLTQCDYGISFHTAIDYWYNIPHIKADVSNPDQKLLARSFGTEVIIDAPGIDGMLRRTMNSIGIPTVILEAGEPEKFQRPIIDMGVTGALNIMSELGIYVLERRIPAFRVIVKRTELVRADRGGILSIYVSPRQLVYKGDSLFSVTNPFGKETDIQKAPFTGMVVGVRTRPIVSPGSSVVHLVKLDKTLSKVEDKLRKSMERTILENGTPELFGPEEKGIDVEIEDYWSSTTDEDLHFSPGGHD